MVQESSCQTCLTTDLQYLLLAKGSFVSGKCTSLQLPPLFRSFREALERCWYYWSSKGLKVENSQRGEFFAVLLDTMSKVANFSPCNQASTRGMHPSARKRVTSVPGSSLSSLGKTTMQLTAVPSEFQLTHATWQTPPSTVLPFAGAALCSRRESVR